MRKTLKKPLTETEITNKKGLSPCNRNRPMAYLEAPLLFPVTVIENSLLDIDFIELFKRPEDLFILSINLF